MDFRERLHDAAFASLTVSQKRLIEAMTGEHRAGEFGWRGSNSTVQMRAMNRKFPLIERQYRGGRNIYRLTPLGKALQRMLPTPAQTASGVEL